MAARVRREIGTRLARGQPGLGAVAKHPGMSERTLHRRLEGEGTKFASLLDDARRERAAILLEDRRLSCSEIAFLLGYTEPAPFFRAFKRWHGVAPQQFRAGGSETRLPIARLRALNDVPECTRTALSCRCAIVDR